jgi:hypothetical protein
MKVTREWLSQCQANVWPKASPLVMKSTPNMFDSQ